MFLSGGVLNVATMIGFITLFGIATRNGIMLVTHIHHLMAVEGVRDFREAVERGAKERLVPILMTAAAAGLALIPLALRRGKTGSEIQTPMAIVILCGLTTSTLLNMFVVPTLYLKFGSRRWRDILAADVKSASRSSIAAAPPAIPAESRELDRRCRGQRRLRRSRDAIKKDVERLAINLQRRSIISNETAHRF